MIDGDRQFALSVVWGTESPWWCSPRWPFFMTKSLVLEGQISFGFTAKAQALLIYHGPAQNMVKWIGQVTSQVLSLLVTRASLLGTKDATSSSWHYY